jgi:hypothetical protein
MLAQAERDRGVFVALAPAVVFTAQRAGLSTPPAILLGFAAIIAHSLSVALGAMSVAEFQYWDAASIFGFGVMGYVFAFGAVYKSVSLEILLDVATYRAACGHRQSPRARYIQWTGGYSGRWRPG